MSSPVRRCFAAPSWISSLPSCLRLCSDQTSERLQAQECLHFEDQARLQCPTLLSNFVPRFEEPALRDTESIDRSSGPLCGPTSLLSHNSRTVSRLHLF